MDPKRALKILGLDDQSSADEIEQRFRALTSQLHPDRGGTNESMAELNEARFVALQATQPGQNLVPLEALNAAMTVAAIRQEERQTLDRRVEDMRKHMHSRSTSKYKRNRKIAGIFAGIAGAAIFLREEIPIDVLFPLSSVSYTLSLPPDEQAELNQWQADRDRSFSAMWSIMFLSIAANAGFAAWFLTTRIDKVNRELEDLEEQTGTKTLLYLFLQEILGEKIRAKWTLSDMVEAISQKETVPKKYVYAADQIGSMRFSQFLIDRALQLNLISVHDEIVQDELVEYYIVTAYRGENI